MARDVNVSGLARRQKRRREPLGPAPEGQPVKGATAIGAPSQTSTVGGVGCEGPFDEVVSSDGFFVWTYPEA